jgi:GTP-binding protein HflX
MTYEHELNEPYKAVLVGAGESRHLSELERLAETLGLSVEGTIEQNRRDGTGYLGKGKREELSSLVADTRADFVVTDDELTSSQARVLEAATDVPLIDLTELIIRIFEAHAIDSASRLEVELADLEYRLPRVKGHNTQLSRLGGGGNTTRGPGEQKLEYDRRTIRRRMGVVKGKLKEKEKARAVRGANMKDQGPQKVALIGYTNAGKTTILNGLSGTKRSTKDRLFETLETTTRSVEGDQQRPDFILTDTVGFISKLPTQLVHSFASTLESSAGADILVLCADASSDRLDEEIRTVRETIGDLIPSGGEGDTSAPKGTILCLNKVDLLSDDVERALRKRHEGAVMISALKDVAPLMKAIQNKIAEKGETLQLMIPHEDYEIATRLYGQADIHDREATEEGILLRITLPESASAKYSKYRVA